MIETQTAPGTMLGGEFIRVIDTESHVVEPPDLWSSRLVAKWQNDGPGVEVRQGSRTGKPHWRIGDAWLHRPGWFGQAGWREYAPSAPVTMEDIEPGCVEPHARLERVTEYDIYERRSCALAGSVEARTGAAVTAAASQKCRAAGQSVRPA